MNDDRFFRNHYGTSSKVPIGRILFGFIVIAVLVVVGVAVLMYR